MDKLRWGILSTARINRRIIPALKASRRNQLTAVASRSLENARQFARQWDIPRSYGSYDVLLEDSSIDVIYIPLPNHLHVEWTLRALQAGKHVLCEKPIALSPEDVNLIQNAAGQKKLVVMEAFMYRHHPQTLKVREIIASGELGEIHLMHGSFSFLLERPDDVRWVPEYGGGSLWDLGCYPVSYCRMIMGTPPTEVCGWQMLSASGVDLVFAGTLRYSGGALAQISSSFAVQTYTGFEIHGSHASLLIPTPFNPQGKSHIILQCQGQKHQFEFKVKDLYLGEIENMADAILDGIPPRIDLQESKQNITTLKALYTSAGQNTAIRLSSE
ncbi:MAG: Gfo/Idh/MocA family oxidoreductase [Anaerolineales bacterium]